MRILDAHRHLWRLDRGDYRWLAGEGGALQPLRRDFLPEHAPDDAEVILVQAADSLAETEFLLDLARGNPRIKGVVGWVDLASPEAAEDLRHLTADPKFKGVRPMLQDIARTDWLLTAPRPEALATLKALGLRFDALATERHLGVLEAFAAAHPDLPLVIDHAAKPQPGELTAWRAGMAALAAHPQVHCKLSGLLTEFSPEQRRDPLPALHAVFDPLLELFGAERLIWGSDWPVLTLAASYEDWLRLTEALLRDLSLAERAGILGANAARFYGADHG
ncbi:amidohydrolase [Neomegalonema sp.]|uniref:amidohydrolase family protein n=1 Tax=Neomegalonema sp. TaxID=2039713 RepID=UPI00261550F5|nr:amidohydrolase family protein [Neomegalonema sp.]MDD2869349.1 amidohydrolase family protein [Neomegalonema sp.]